MSRKQRTRTFQAMAETSSNGSQYSNEDRRAAAVSFAIYGSSNHASEHCGIPARTIRDWTKTEWFQDLLTVVREEHDQELDARFSRAIDKTFECVEDRLENGDEIYVGGEVKRRKVSGKDAAVIGAVMFDKRQLLRNRPTAIRQESTDKAMRERLEQFERLAGATIVEGRVIEEHHERAE